eukprot:9484417-Heterocapsa_arctica.AAC.1
MYMYARSSSRPLAYLPDMHGRPGWKYAKQHAQFWHIWKTCSFSMQTTVFRAMTCATILPDIPPIII